MTLRRAQEALVVALADRGRTTDELAVVVARDRGDLQRELLRLRKLGLVQYAMDVCPLCGHVSGGKFWTVTDAGQELADRLSRAAA